MKAIVVNTNDKSIHLIDTGTNIPQGPFLQPLGTGSVLLDVVVTSDGRTAIISDFDTNGRLYFIDLTPSTPTTLGWVSTGISAEDIAVSPNGRCAVVTGGGGEDRIVSVDVVNRERVQSLRIAEPLTNPRIQAVAIAPDGETVLAADTAIDRVYVLRLNSQDCTLEYSGEYVRTGDRPINIAISPDGRTALVANYWDDSVTVLRIEGPGNVVKDRELEGFPGGQQSIAFSPDGSKAYVLSTNPDPDQLSILDFGVPWSGSPTASIELRTRTSCGFYGVDPLAVSPDGRKAYVGNPCGRGDLVLDEVTVVDLTSHRVIDQVPVGRYPAGIALIRAGGLPPTPTPAGVYDR